jgi:hypothetical protein
MNRLRKIYKGEENWDVIYNEQDEILKPAKSNKGIEEVNSAAGINSPVSSKIYKEDHKNSYNVASNNSNIHNPNPNFNKITNKLSNVSITNNKNMRSIDNENIDETDIQDLIFQNVEVGNEEKKRFESLYDVREEDYDNFEHCDMEVLEPNIIHMSSHSNSNSNLIEENSNFKYQNEKRSFSQAFNDVNMVETISEDGKLIQKKKKLN